LGGRNEKIQNGGNVKKMIYPERYFLQPMPRRERLIRGERRAKEWVRRFSRGLYENFGGAVKALQSILRKKI